jgi:hypothetical protein
VDTYLPFHAPLDSYQRQADALLAGWQAGDERAVRVFRSRHPKFLDDRIPWLERRMTDAEVRAIPIDLDDARLALARAYEYLDWAKLREHVEAIQQPGPVRRFEEAVEAVIGGDVVTLRRLLAEDPDLVRARSTRACCFDPPVHRATLLHYLAANGVETYHQKSPPNAVEVAKVLLDAGADPNALQDSYGGRNTTMSMLVSSTPPREAGVQVPLVEILIDYGAMVGRSGAGAWTSPLETALVFGMHDAARTLVRRGAPIETLAAAAGLGRLDDVRRMLPGADALDRHRALALAAQSGHAGVVAALIDAGEDPNRFNPPGTHSHAQPLHQAIAAGHLEVVKLLIARGAKLDTRDTTFKSTPLGWAEYCGKPAIASYLRAQGASG